MSKIITDKVIPEFKNNVYIPDTIVQVQTIQTSDMSAFTSPPNTANIITPLTIQIKPYFKSSKIIIQWMINGEVFYNNIFRIYKNFLEAPNGRNINVSSRWSGFIAPRYEPSWNLDSTPTNCFIQYIDSPNTTDLIFYQVAIGCSDANTYTMYLNRSAANYGADNYEIMTSTAVAWEVSQ